ncbi:COMM domain-containing protein 5 [Geodia barretti]|uniref:COMM domain-containing protein 5 n=1 Tax=Geodia barretti TaxID=519541 RepID=A0AA35TN78_GEOBA|nr:COMM domain-containing protein 5 [Geodia barretti]
MSAVQVMAQSGAGGAADRTPFYGIKVPQELRKTVQLAKNMDTALFKKIVQCVAEYVETGSGSRDCLSGLGKQTSPEEDIRTVFAGVHCVLTAALRTPKLKSAVFKEDLQLIKMPPEMIATLNSVIFSSKTRQARLERCLLQQRVRLPQMDTLRWRLDVAISNSSLHRVLEPSILMEMTLSDGTIKTFEIPVSKFHELRYSVAYVLKEMEDLEKRNILKLQD